MFLRRLQSIEFTEITYSGSEYFLCRCASKVSFGTLRTPFFSSSNNFLVNLNGFLLKARLAFLFFTVSLCFPPVIFLYLWQMLFYQSLVTRYFLQSFLQTPLFESKLTFLSLSSTGSFFFYGFAGLLIQRVLNKLHTQYLWKNAISLR